MVRWLALLLVSFLGATCSAQEAPTFEEGVDYHWVAPNPAPGEKIEVLEFFWYACPHCYDFEPFLGKWLETKPDDVTFARVPATFDRPEVMNHARTFYALESMGVPAQIHKDIMDEIALRHNRLSDEAAMEKFLDTRGIDVAAFREAMKSFAVYVKVQQAAQLAQRYGVNGVPSLVVDGQYRNGDVNSHERMIGLLDYLIDQARQGRAGQ